MLKQKHTC